MRINVGFLTMCAAWLVAGPSWAQELRERPDSLEREVRALRLQVDSLRSVVQQLVREGRDTAEVVDELAAIRAAARAAMPDPPADSTPERFVIRSRNLNQLNPEISVTADVRLQANRPGPQQDNVEVREFAFAFQSALDPYANTKIFAAFSEHHVGIEEAYAYWTGLPGGIRADVGRFRQQVGELNRWHLHAVPESEYPLPITEFFGHHGLVGDGLSLYWIAPLQAPGHGVHELWGQVTLANNDVLFDGGRRLSVLGHLNNFWQLSRSTYFQVGGTALYGRNPDAALSTQLFGADVRVTWRPPEQALYRALTLRGEGFAVRRSVGGIGETRYGAYAGVDYQTSRRLHIGARIDWVEALDDGEHRWAFVPRATWWQSEWVYLRAEWQHHSAAEGVGGRTSNDRFILQIVWSIGPHKHESY